MRERRTEEIPLILIHFCSEMFRVWRPQPTVGECDLRDLDMPGVLRETPGARGPPLLRQVCHHGQVEGCGAGEDEGRREQEGQGLPG